MSAAMMSAPSCASRTAWLRPWPRAAPVISATFPSSLPMVSPAPSCWVIGGLSDDVHRVEEARPVLGVAVDGHLVVAPRSALGRPHREVLGDGGERRDRVCRWPRPYLEGAVAGRWDAPGAAARALEYECQIVVNPSHGVPAHLLQTGEHPFKRHRHAVGVRGR